MINHANLHFPLIRRVQQKNRLKRRLRKRSDCLEVKSWQAARYLQRAQLVGLLEQASHSNVFVL